MNVAQALRAAQARLEATSDTARLDAELLMANALGISRSDMLLRHMTAPAPENFEALISRRAQHEPVAYILGSAEFYGRAFAVNPAVLIPRSDSESVVELALKHAPETGRVLDMGTGSGALLLTILAERDQWSGMGIDASAPALEVARQNAGQLGLADRVSLMLADWTNPGWHTDLGRFNLVICNPPYVETGAALDADVSQYEPESALFAGPQGLDDYRIIIPQLGNLLTETGVAILEIGRDQAETVAKIAHESGYCTELTRDLAGRPRALHLSQVK